MHDIATPVFAHTIDFLNGDYENQESTELGTFQIIDSSDDIQKGLRLCGLKTEDVADYHMFPIADNDSPQLSADRLEYTLGNLYNYGICSLEEIKDYYDDIIVTHNELGNLELAFQTLKTAISFTQNAFKTFSIYVSQEDRFSMQVLANLIAYSVEKGMIKKDDLYKQE